MINLYPDENISNYLKNVSKLTISNVVNELELPKGTLSSFTRNQLSSETLKLLFDTFEYKLNMYKSDLEQKMIKVIIITIVKDVEEFNDGYSVYGQKKRIEEYLSLKKYNVPYIKYSYIDVIRHVNANIENQLVGNDFALLFSKKLLEKNDYSIIKNICYKHNITLDFVQD